MYVKKISLKNFRNYQEETFEFNHKVNIIVGENGKGKTNLLESIYINSIGKSFRTLKDKDMIMFEKDFFRLNLFYEKDGENEIEISIDKEGHRKCKINGVKIEKRSEILNNLIGVVFSPEDLKIVKEDPEKRRNFIDNELCQISILYYKNLNSYKKVLTQRNNYLKSEKLNLSLLDVWDENLVNYGSQIILKRSEFIKKLNKISKSKHDKISDKKENLDVFYDSNINVEENLENQKKVFKEALIKAREKDIEKKITSKGPHRDDLGIIINNIDARRFASQGQQRTAALALKLSEIDIIKEEKEETPILLLDDVMSELDEKRQKYLIKSLNDVQIFVTTAEMNESLIESIQNKKVIEIK